MSMDMDCTALVKHLRRIARQSGQAAEATVEALSGRGAELSGLLAPAGSGELRASIRALPITGTGVSVSGGWVTNSDHAAYIELGTGVPGAAGEVANGQQRNPAAGSYAYTRQSVIRSGPREGQIQDGWVYYSDRLGRFVHTYGQPAQPFMYPAAMALGEEAADLASVAVRSVIK